MSIPLAGVTFKARTEGEAEIKRLVAIATVLAALGLTASAGAAVRTLATQPNGIIGFAHDGGRVAWVTRGCRAIRILTIWSGAVASIPPPRSRCPPYEPLTHIAVARKRALWTEWERGGILVSNKLVTAALDDRRRTTITEFTTLDLSGYGTRTTGLAGDGGTLVYAWVDMQAINDCVEQPNPCLYAPQDGRVVRLVGTERNDVPEAPAAAELAAGSNRIALAPASTTPSEDSTPKPSPGGPVQVRDATTGTLASSFSPPGTVKALALTGKRVAALTRLASNNQRIEVRDLETGAVALSKRVSGAAAPILDMAGSRIVFRIGRIIRVLSIETNSVQTVARARATPRGLSIEDRRVTWAENLGGRGYVRSVKLR